MISYRDTGSDEHVCPGQWFDQHLVPDALEFRGQFGFFRYGALAKYRDTIKGMADQGKTVRLVLGSNATDPLTVNDVLPVAELLLGGRKASLTLISYSNALFHPKVAHIVRANGSAVGIVGSPNLTVQALGTHVEAWVELEGGADTDTALRDIMLAIDRWPGLTIPGVFQILRLEDIDGLVTRGIILPRPLPRPRPPLGAGARTTPSGRATRRQRWRPPAVAATDAELDVLPEGTEPAPVVAPGVASPVAPAPPAAAPPPAAAHTPPVVPPPAAAPPAAPPVPGPRNFAMVLAAFDVSHRTGVKGTPEMSLPGDVEPFFGPLGNDSRNLKHAGRHFNVQIEAPGVHRMDEYRAWRREAGAGGNADFRLRVSHELVDATDPAGGDILHIERRPGNNPEYRVRVVRPTDPDFPNLYARADRLGGTGGAAGQKKYGMW